MDTESETAGRVDVAELLKLRDAASPLPWPCSANHITQIHGSFDRSRENYVYLIAAANAVPELVSRLRKAMGVIESSNGSLEWAASRIAELEALVLQLGNRAEKPIE